MAVIKLQPRNLPGIRKHFDTRIKDVKKKLGDINKRRVAFENELAVLEDGKQWCDNVYEASKTKVVKKKL